MNKDKYVFASLAGFLDNNKFRHLVDKYQGDRYIKSFTCWNQLLTMMFGQLCNRDGGQLCNRDGLRDLIVALEAHHGKLYHLGMGKSVTRSNLSKANENRDCRIFEEFAFYMIDVARKKRATKIFDLDGRVYAFDSTTIDLCLEVFWWAKFRKHKGGVKMHTLYDVETQIPAYVHITPASVHDSKVMLEIPYEKNAHYIFDRGYNDFGSLYKIHQIEAFFVVRAKRNVKFKAEKWKRRLPETVLSDAIGHFTVYNIFLTNDFESDALTIALLYKYRWSIELFFKWLKQHLKIKRFWGTSENAVRIQIYCAIITYCLIAIVQHDMKLERSIYEILQILSISLTDKTPLRDLFDKQNFNNVKELNGSSEPSLFENFIY